MTLQDIANIVASWQMPFAYYEFEDEVPEPPYVVYYLDGSEDFFADNVNYSQVRTLYIELYASSKKEAMSKESVIEGSLVTNEMPFAKDNDYISGERLYVTVYTLEVNL